MSQGWATIELEVRCRLNMGLKIYPETGYPTILSKTHTKRIKNFK